MEIYEVKFLDCREKKNRKILVENLKQVMKIDHNPDKDEIKEFARKVQKKYGYRFKKMDYEEKGKYLLAIECEKGTYSTMICYSHYEIIAKYILYVKAHRKYKSMVKK